MNKATVAKISPMAWSGEAVPNSLTQATKAKLEIEVNTAEPKKSLKKDMRGFPRGDCRAGGGAGACEGTNVSQTSLTLSQNPKAGFGIGTAF